MTWRQYDPAIGRWLVIDPRVEDLESITPYNAFLNNPVTYSDPEGDISPQLIAGAIGALWEYGSQVYSNYQSGATGYDAWIGNVDFADVATEGIATGLTMGTNKIAGDFHTKGIKASVDLSAIRVLKLWEFTKMSEMLQKQL